MEKVDIIFSSMKNTLERVYSLEELKKYKLGTKGFEEVLYPYLIGK